ncbi:MAG: hypothetical protein AB7N76_12965 [Planctomycetota bacterium]
MARPALQPALALALLLLAAPARAGDPRQPLSERRPSAAQAAGLTVQRRWRLLALELDTDPRLELRRWLPRYARAIERELPGLEVSFDVERWRRLETSPPERARLLALDPERRDAEVVRTGLGLGLAAGLDLADYDAVFVVTPLASDRLFGLSHIDLRDARGRVVRGGLINTRPLEVLAQGLLRTLAGQQSGAEAGGEGREGEQAGRLVRALSRVRELRERLLAPTIAHELGHFLAPGDRDVRDGYQRPWLQHATGPDDNPEGHGVECCMFKGRDLRFWVEKVLSTRGRLVLFCDACRKQLGCDPRRRWRPL